MTTDNGAAGETTVRFRSVTYTYPEGDRPVFRGLDLDLPTGVVSFIGQNGTGKSTALLLASGRILPQEGTVTIQDTDTAAIGSEAERNLLVSFIYQNMEFESEETIWELMLVVHEQGALAGRDPKLVSELVDVMDIGGILNKRIHKVSKGELQRTIMAFSLLYGSPFIMMDEPIFALEWPQKEKIMDFLYSFARDRGITIYYSLHELELSHRFSDTLVLFSMDGSIRVGKTEELYDRDILEKAYEVPYGLLYQKENLYRKHLLEIGDHLKRARDIIEGRPRP